MRRLLLVLLLILCCTAGAMAAEPIRIGVSLGLTGSFAEIGRVQEMAFTLWRDHVNAAGGILGRPVALSIHDDQSNQQKMLELYRKMILEDKVDLLFPPYSSGFNLALLPITEAHQYPLLTHGAAADSLWEKGYRYVFGVYPPSSQYSLGFMELILTRGLTRVAILASDDPFGQGIAAGAQRWANQLGLQIVLRESFEKGLRDLRPLAEKARDARAEAVLMCGHYNEGTDMRLALQQIGWQPRAYWASVAPVIPAYYEKLGAAAENSFSATQWHYYDKLPYPGSREFHASFLSRFGIEPPYHAATSYASGDILKQAIERAGSLDRVAVRDQLLKLDVMTMLGRFGVDSSGRQVRYFHLTTQWQDGRQQVVWPLDLSNAKPRLK